MRTTLRALVLTEIGLGLTFLVAEWYSRRFLPQALQDFLTQTEAAELAPYEWIVLALGLGLLGLLTAAWIAVWRLSKRARFLYSLA